LPFDAKSVKAPDDRFEPKWAKRPRSDLPLLPLLQLLTHLPQIEAVTEIKRRLSLQAFSIEYEVRATAFHQLVTVPGSTSTGLFVF
jgi:hypothetical protein